MSLGSHLEKPGLLEATATAISHRCSFLLFENKSTNPFVCGVPGTPCFGFLVMSALCMNANVNV